MYGTNEKLLRVNLSTGTLVVETISEDFYRLYRGERRWQVISY